MANVSSSSSSGIGFFGLLTIVFIVLKLLDKIAWSWFWVLSPTLIPLGCLLVFLMFCLGMAVATGQVKRRKTS